MTVSTLKGISPIARRESRISRDNVLAGKKLHTMIYVIHRCVDNVSSLQTTDDQGSEGNLNLMGRTLAVSNFLFIF